MRPCNESLLIVPPILRTRSRTFPKFIGYHYPASNPSDLRPSEVATGMEECEDTHGSRETANYFDLTRWKLSPGRITGIEGVWPVYGLNNYPYLNQPTPDFLPGSDAQFMDPAAALTKVASWTSPGRAEVSFLNFIYELRELPEMLWKRKPNSKGNSVAEQNFGWDPLLSDVAKLFKFSQQFERRLKELNAIYDRPGGLKRQRVLAEGHSRSTVTLAVNSWICGVTVERSNHTMSRQWASLAWKPLFGAMATKPDATALASKAIAAIHGWRANPGILWDALPWSWLVDYFANVGDLIEASSNSFEYFPDMCCVMNTSTAVISDHVINCSVDFTVTPARLEAVWKHRQPTSFGFRFLTPLLSGKQLVTLAGIASKWR